MKTKRSPFYDATQADRMKELSGVRLASFGFRAVALWLDFMVAGVLFLALMFAAMTIVKRTPALHEWLNDRLHGHDLHIELSFFHNWYSVAYLALYFGLMLYWGHGRTPGKRLMKIRVVSLHHDHLSLWHCFERALGYGASVLELGFGFFQYFIHPNRQTVHDRIAETIVVDERKVDRRVPSVALTAHAHEADA
jgi:uncharacterized RDD family membrane protein YckC